MSQLKHQRNNIFGQKIVILAKKKQERQREKSSRTYGDELVFMFLEMQNKRNRSCPDQETKTRLSSCEINPVADMPEIKILFVKKKKTV